MNIKPLILTTLLLGTMNYATQAIDIDIPGADPALPTTIYTQNIVSQEALSTSAKESRASLEKIAKDSNRIEKTIARINENIKAANYSSTIFILSDKDRHVKFTIPKNSIDGMVMPFGSNYSQYITTTNGNIGLEVSKIKDSSTWETSGKSYADITKADMQEAFSKHNPGPNDSFVDGGKFTYPGLDNATWDVAKAGKDTISTINFSLSDAPDYMYHVGLIDTTDHADYISALSRLGNYTIPSITSQVGPSFTPKRDTIGNFTISLLPNMIEEKNTLRKDGGGVKSFRSNDGALVVTTIPFNKELTLKNVFDKALTDSISMPIFDAQDTTNYYTVWHNGVPGYLIDTIGHGDRPSIMTYITHDNKTMLKQAIIYKADKISVSHNDLIATIINVDVTPVDSEKNRIMPILKEIKL